MDFQKTEYDDSAVQKALKSGSETMFYAPMACLMFVGFRMRVLQLTKGTGNPQDWVRWCMIAVTYSITVNTIMPGATFTEVERKTVTPQQKEAIVASQCIQRPATPDDIVGTVLFLCSRESGFLTGQAITVDGGATHG